LLHNPLAKCLFPHILHRFSLGIFITFPITIEAINN